MNVADRAAGAVIGALIGDALGLGPHRYYDLTELRRDYGDWITGYTDPKPGRYHAGMKAGQLSQTGLILVMLLRSVVEKGKYTEQTLPNVWTASFCPFWTGHRCRVREDTPTNLSGKPTGAVFKKLDWHSDRRTCRYHRKPPKELSCCSPLRRGSCQKVAETVSCQLPADPSPTRPLSR